MDGRQISLDTCDDGNLEAVTSSGSFAVDFFRFENSIEYDRELSLHLVVQKYKLWIKNAIKYVRLKRSNCASICRTKRLAEPRL